MTPTQRALAALQASKLNSPDYLEQCLLMRTTQRLGSWYPHLSPKVLFAALLASDWEEKEVEEVTAPATLYVTRDIGGMVGMVEVKPSYRYVLRLDDTKGTGYLSVVTSEGTPYASPFTSLIVGPDGTAGEKTMWTFHPGMPAPKPGLRPDPVKGLVHGVTLTCERAYELGFRWAKLEA